ncbi:MAG TPA: ankyrin repeat domain-containing protein [Fimbriimonas sp.]|nr:ankyrin repeat domain-containing protein [Fimbriimonas sp.]
MPHKHLPQHPNLAHLRNQARDLMKGHREGDVAVLQRIREFHPELLRLTDAQITARAFRLADAQLTIAREYMFESWPKLKASIESGNVPDESVPLEDRITDPTFREAVRLIDVGNVEDLRLLLRQHSNLAKQHVFFNASGYFGRPGLLQFVAENPIRQEAMPNAVETAKVIIEAGATREDITDTLGLVATGRVPREQGVQVPLIDLLCDHGAIVGSLLGVLAHGEFQAAEALIRRGARVTLPVAAALDRWPEFESLLRSASDEDRHLALALSAQFGRTRMLRRLLEAGEEPNRYNPPGAHAHSTPLHQAVIHEHYEAVEILLEAGARTDIPDTIHHGTPIGWARYANLPHMEKLLEGTA